MKQKMKGTARYKANIPVHIVSINFKMQTALVSDDDTLRAAYNVLIEDLDRWELLIPENSVHALPRPNAGYGITDTANKF